MPTSSPFVGAIEPVTESDEAIRAFLDEAEVPPLLPALAYLTGDLSLLRDELRPDSLLFLMGFPQGGLTDKQQSEARDLAARTLIAYREGGCRPAPPPSDEALMRIMQYTVGGEDMSEYLPLLAEELDDRGIDRRAPGWTLSELAPDLAGSGFQVAIIGAGLSGLLVAHRLKQAGVPFVIFEKSDDVGGTWHDNSYPGCRVDNPNHNYSYSFAQRHDWPFHFSTQDVLLDYFRACADTFGLRGSICFHSEVLSATWDEGSRTWSVRVRHFGLPSGEGHLDLPGGEGNLDLPGGEEKTYIFGAIVSAVGQLNRPKLPAIEGLDTFRGPAFHSARWRHDVDLGGKRIAVIGTGASAVQFIPEIAKVASEVTIFQRTPPWLYPTPEYHDAVPSGLRWLYSHVPSYSEWNRFCIFWKMGDGALANVAVDDEWDNDGLSVSAMNEMMRQVLAEYLRTELAGRPDLLAVAIPTYPPGAKRILRDNGIWPSTLKRANVRLAAGPIARITSEGVVTRDGEVHQADVLVYGTGFKASEFLAPMKVTGRSGIDLHEHWNGEARAFLGVTVPGFPNFFCLYGPNTNIVVNGSIIYFSECGTRYILDCLRLVLQSGHRALDVRKDVHDEYNEQVDSENARMAWGRSDVSSWYRNERGHVAQNWPFTLLEYWRRTLRADPHDYELFG